MKVLSLRLRVITFALIAFLAPAACAPAPSPPGEPAVVRRAPSLRQIASATFTGIYDDPVRLIEGRYEGLPAEPPAASHPILELVSEIHAEGDLDGDGAPEAAVLLVEESGGTATNIYLAAVGIREGAPVSMGSLLVGDRVQVRGMSVSDGRVHLALVTHGSDDAMCCPSHLVEKAWTLSGGRLQEVASREEGLLGVATLSGTRWKLVRFGDLDLRAAAEPIDLAVDEGRVAGSSGCNSYSGRMASPGGGTITIGPILTTRKSCPRAAMDLEGSFLRAISGARGFGFRMGRLSILYEDGDRSGALLFAAAEATTGGRADERAAE